MKLIDMLRKILLVSVLIFLTSSCIVNITNHGYEQLPENFIQLQTNKSHKMDVLEMAGSPSVISTFDPNIWYYVTTKTKRVSIFNPQVIESLVIQLNFTKDETLSDVAVYNMNDSRKLVFNKSQSSIKGDDTNMLKDFFYNFGRFNKTGK